MLEQTLTHLDSRDYLRDGKPWRNGLVEPIRDLLLERPVDSLDAEEITAKARTVTEIRESILGASGVEEVDRELDDIVRSLVGADDKGRVHRSLENGYCVCAATVLRTSGDGTVRKSARFVSENPDVVQQFRTTRYIDKAIKAATKANAVMADDIKRVPVLASRRPLLARRTQEQLAIAMPLNGEDS